ncbi:rhodanese-like domain-containing protein [Aquabacterium sp. A7-Y]|uniref:rhodanese-like domain-containing protein n=1 Tax=Aquabacterium sp. A7-Y TaxID=1349605 RepID=UPI00223DBB9E|nr:rhodanese-like domain-containing protein [Aquabacterium sp. A7-Y]MCW7538263.1 rhodanese-like domain-containing protein [Aquabacterium sp. A7-Y]
MQQLSVRDTRHLIATADPARPPLLLDVREPWEFSLAAIRLAAAETLHIPMQQVPARLAEIPRDRTVICVCHHGMRSLQVAHYLAAQGHDDVINLQGGIDAWSQEVDPDLPRY